MTTQPGASLLALFVSLSQPLHAQLTYVDASSGAGGNTTLADGSDFNPPLNGTTGADNLWEQRTTFASGGTIFESGGEVAEDAAELKTTISGLTPGGFYTVYLHFWDSGGADPDWNVRAGFSTAPGTNTIFANPADTADLGATAGVLASTLAYTAAPTVFVEADRTMYAAEVGTVTADVNGRIEVFIDDLPSPIGPNNRTWYDGLSHEPVPDEDMDGLPDEFELAHTDPPSTTALNPGEDIDAGGAGDGLTNLQEFSLGTDPNNPDSDDDGLDDGPEINATLNDRVTPTGFASTNPLNPDSDAGVDGRTDGVRDGDEVSGALNSQFANAPTDPNNPDSDDDGMDDGYELANNHPGTALDPNDDGTGDPTQDPFEDRDGDSLDNIDEFDGFTLGVQTRADLIDTDGDGLDDHAEDNVGSWLDVEATGTNPILADSDGDGLLDGEENYDLSEMNGGTGFPGQGVLPTNSDPNNPDTDGDQYYDSFEVAQGTDPDDSEATPVQVDGFVLVEDFEGSGMAIGQTINGVNGWTVTLNPQAAFVTDEPVAGGDKVVSLTYLGGTDAPAIRKSLALSGLQIMEGNTGTLFFQLRTGPGNHDSSIGLSDAINPTVFGDYEAQMGVIAQMGVRDSGAFRGGLADYPRQEWMNVWIAADNSTDTVRVWVESPTGETGQVEITEDGGADPFGFRNGTTDALNTVLLIISQNSPDDASILIDNIYVDPTDLNLSTPAVAKPEALPDLRITDVFFEAGNLKIVFSPGGSGFILTSSDTLTLPFTEETGAIYDGIDTFTVPAAFLNPGKDFFRVEQD